MLGYLVCKQQDTIDLACSYYSCLKAFLAVCLKQPL